MGNSGKAFKEIQDLTIEDFTPDHDEMDLLFCSLVPMYSHTLLQRHPTLFKSLRSSINDYENHQFTEEKSKKFDDKGGSAVSITYISKEPIIFVGTGPTYTDLKSINSKVNYIFLNITLIQYVQAALLK